MADYNSLGFAFVGLKTTQFSTNDKAYRSTGNLDLQTEMGFGIDVSRQLFIAEVKFNFLKKKDAPFMQIALQGQFEINKEGWQEITDSENHIFNFPKELITHLVVLTIGATRGALHAKTEGSVYNSYILPTVNVDEMINGDLLFNEEGMLLNL